MHSRGCGWEGGTVSLDEEPIGLIGPLENHKASEKARFGLPGSLVR